MRVRGAAMAGLMLAGAAPPAGERVVAADAVAPAIVDGVPVRLRVEPGAPGMPILSPALAVRLGLKGGFFGLGVRYRIGPETASGSTQVVRFAWTGGAAGRRRIGWIARAYAPPADGPVGPGGLPEPVVRFALRVPRVGERTAALPMAGGGGLFGEWSATGAAVTVGGVAVRVRFDPHHPRSLANAAAADAIGRAEAGVMTAEGGRQEIAFGIERPYRVMRLGRPLTIGGVSLDRIGVRVPDGDAAIAPPDPDEVVVAARRGKPRPALLILGADALAACSSLTFDKPARAVRMTCG